MPFSLHSIRNLLRPSIVIAAWLGSVSLAVAQSGVQCDVLRFRSAEATFIEVHMDFESALLRPSPVEGGWSTLALFEAVVEGSDGIVNYGKTTISGPLQSDSLDARTGQQFHLERIEVPPGSFQVTVHLKDLHPESSFERTSTVPVHVEFPDSPAFSDPFIVQAFAPTATGEQTMLSRSGYEMLPLTANAVSTEGDKIQFYSELYHIDQVVDSMFLVVCWLEDENGRIFPSSRRFFRKNAEPILPFFLGLSTADIQTGQSVQLVIQALTRENQLITENVLPLVFESPSEWPLVASGSAQGIPPYLLAYTDSLSLMQHIRDHHPKADASQRKTIDQFLESADVRQMQAFLTHFWEQNAPEDPESAWRSYATAIAYADSSYGACRQGHGAQTDMGYIYLRYGPPNTVVKRHNETDYYPYEIWHYHRAGPFTNKRFLFFSPHMVAECFTLLHSDMLGEVQNSDWLHQLRNRENRLRVTDSQLNRLNPRRDTFSGEEPEDLFFNPR